MTDEELGTRKRISVDHRCHAAALLKHGPIVSLADGAPGAPERRIIAALDPGKERPIVFLRPARAVAG